MGGSIRRSVDRRGGAERATPHRPYPLNPTPPPLSVATPPSGGRARRTSSRARGGGVEVEEDVAPHQPEDRTHRPLSNSARTEPPRRPREPPGARVIALHNVPHGVHRCLSTARRNTRRRPPRASCAARRETIGKPQPGASSLGSPQAAKPSSRRRVRIGKPQPARRVVVVVPLGGLMNPPSLPAPSCGHTRRADGSARPPPPGNEWNGRIGATWYSIASCALPPPGETAVLVSAAIAMK